MTPVAIGSISSSYNHSGVNPMPGWNRVVPLTISHTGAGGSDQTNFPVTITNSGLPTEIFSGGYAANSDGGDLRFTSDAGATTKLHAEIRTWTPETPFAKIFVCLPTYSSSSDTTIYLWYNNPGATMPESSDYTWGSQYVWISDYLAVYHMDEVGTGQTIQDSTSYENDSTSNSSVSISGMVGVAQSYTASSSQETILPALLGGSSELTLECWIYPNVSGFSDGQNGLFIAADNPGSSRSYILGGEYYGGTFNPYVIVFAGSGYTYHGGESAPYNYVNGVWQHTALTWDGTTLAQYVNANLNTLTPWDSSSASGSIATNSDDTRIGSRKYSGDRAFFNGYIWEVRLSTTARSASWISATKLVADGSKVTSGTPGPA